MAMVRQKSSPVGGGLVSFGNLLPGFRGPLQSGPVPKTAPFRSFQEGRLQPDFVRSICPPAGIGYAARSLEDYRRLEGRSSNQAVDAERSAIKPDVSPDTSSKDPQPPPHRPGLPRPKGGIVAPAPSPVITPPPDGFVSPILEVRDYDLGNGPFARLFRKMTGGEDGVIAMGYRRNLSIDVLFSYFNGADLPRTHQSARVVKDTEIFD